MSIYMSFRAARITIRRRAGIRLRRWPPQHNGRIRRQRRNTLVVVLLLFVVVSVLVSLVVNNSFEVVKLVSLLVVVNFVVDLMMCVILVWCMIYLVYSTCFGGSLSGEAVKIDSSKKIKLLYSSVNGRI
jgi:hypothetical protein